MIEHHEEMTLNTQKKYIYYLLAMLNEHVRWDRNYITYEIIKIT